MAHETALPFNLSTPQEGLPEGTFLLPICVTRETYQKLLDAVWYGRLLKDPLGKDLEDIAPFLEAQAFVGGPSAAPCFPGVNLCQFILDVAARSNGRVDTFLEVLAIELAKSCVQLVIDTVLDLVYEGTAEEDPDGTEENE